VIAATPADARRHYNAKRSHASHHTSHAASHSSYSPPYSAIIVDGNSGVTLHESSADSQRHPASLTKIMTLYLLFEQFEAKKLTLDSQIPMSEHCASRPPTKLGIEPGGGIRSEDAIKALVTRSANDVACAIGEMIGGNEETFAGIMTKKAHAIGMTRTVYRNASGLPDDEQVTTARDQATLGRAIQDRFPRYYSYFSTVSFTWHGHPIRNHNHLVGNMEGVDGIKTGFVTASGFNLVSSIRRNGHHLVGVVMGGSSAGARDSRMRELLTEYINKGSTRRSAPLIAEGHPPAVISAAAAKPEPTAEVSIAATPAAPFVGAPTAAAQPAAPVARQAAARVQQSPAPIEATAAAISPVIGSSDDIRPIHVKTLKVRAATLRTAAIGSPSTPPVAETAAAAPAAEPAPAPQSAPSTPVAAAAPAVPTPAAAPAAPVAAAPAPPPAPVVAAAPPTPPPAPAPVVAVAAPTPAPTRVAAAAPPTPTLAPVVAAAPPAPAPVAATPPEPAPPTVATTAAAPSNIASNANKTANEAPKLASAVAPAASVAPTAATATSDDTDGARDGWIIQVGALETVGEANERLGSAQTRAAHLLRRAKSFTEKVVKGDKTLYRARFAGLDRGQAEAACRTLKHDDIPCILVAGK
jgi:D-alanyl-D-alanine carboxypeptidase